VTGEAAVGNVSLPSFQTISAAGPAISAVFNMQGRLSPNSVLIDTTTFQSIEVDETVFHKAPNPEKSGLYRLIYK
ncbi:MAG: hypothetical protein AAFN12_19610, partial [Cyanobacteria bacterium J06560_2]